MSIARIFLYVTLFATVCISTSCEKDEEFPDDIMIENCNDTGCVDKSCAYSLDVNTRLVACFLNSDNDVDWYQFTVTETDVNIGTLSYDFTFNNKTENMSIMVDLFLDGITNGGVLTSGNGDGIYAPMEELTGVVTFLDSGIYYIKVSRNSGNRGDGAYKFMFN
jgi:hypothetical protein